MNLTIWAMVVGRLWPAVVGGPLYEPEHLEYLAMVARCSRHSGSCNKPSRRRGLVCGSWAWACGQALRLNLSIRSAIAGGARGAQLETCKYMTRKDCRPLQMQLSRGPDGRKMKLQ